MSSKVTSDNFDPDMTWPDWKAIASKKQNIISPNNLPSLLSIILKNNDWNMWNYIWSSQGTAGKWSSIYNEFLFQCAELGKKEMIRTWVNKGLSINIQNAYGETPLHIATSKGDVDWVKCLLEFKPDLMLKTKEKLSVFDYSFEQGNSEIGNLLSLTLNKNKPYMSNGRRGTKVIKTNNYSKASLKGKVDMKIKNVTLQKSNSNTINKYVKKNKAQARGRIIGKAYKCKTSRNSSSTLILNNTLTENFSNTPSEREDAIKQRVHQDSDFENNTINIDDYDVSEGNTNTKAGEIKQFSSVIQGLIVNKDNKIIIKGKKHNKDKDIKKKKNNNNNKNFNPITERFESGRHKKSRHKYDDIFDFDLGEDTKRDFFHEDLKIVKTVKKELDLPLIEFSDSLTMTNKDKTQQYTHWSNKCLSDTVQNIISLAKEYNLAKKEIPNQTWHNKQSSQIKQNRNHSNIIISTKGTNIQSNTIYPSTSSKSNANNFSIIDNRDSLDSVSISNWEQSNLYSFWADINWESYATLFYKNGFDDIDLLLDQTKNGEIAISDKNLYDIGMKKPGDRAKFLVRLEEKAQWFGWKAEKEKVYNNSCVNNNGWYRMWSTIKMEGYISNFISNSYYSSDLLLIQMLTKHPVTDEIWMEIGIDKIGYRRRILNKWANDSQVYFRKMKSRVLVIETKKNEIDNNEFCNMCIII